MSTSGTPARHTLTPIEVHFPPSTTSYTSTTIPFRALTESTGSIAIRLTHAGTTYDIVSWGRFISRVERLPDTGDWKILTFEVIYDRDSINPVIPGANAPEGFEEQTKGTKESYRCLGWGLMVRGYEIDWDLPGTDRPESVREVMEGGMGWLVAFGVRCRIVLWRSILFMD